MSVATVPRTERRAPDVTAIGGAEAVAIVRAGGFIAAIESVASELSEGTVIEQEPSAGDRLGREGVITLRLATPSLDRVQLGSVKEAGLASEQAAGICRPGRHRGVVSGVVAQRARHRCRCDIRQTPSQASPCEATSS